MKTTRLKNASALTIIAFLATTGCETSLVDSAEATLARNHLATLLDIMEANSINRRTIDWPAFRASVMAEAPDPDALHDTFEAIHTALGLLGDNHSSYTAPPSYGVTITNGRVACSGALPATLDAPPDVGYVRVQGFSGSIGSGMTYATQLQTQIRTEDGTGDVIGWVVDLRGNSATSMWPMIVGLGPLLGETTLGYSIDPVGVESRWEYRAGVGLLAGQAVLGITSPYTPKNPGPRVAMLIDERVSGAGEAVVVAFKGRPNTRFFGSATCGLTAMDSQFVVDGAVLTLAVASIADRNKVVYPMALVPDESLPLHAAALERAVAWLRGP